jgi:hypothetical protein
MPHPRLGEGGEKGQGPLDENYLVSVSLVKVTLRASQPEPLTTG